MTETVDKSFKRLGVTLSKPALAVVFIIFSILIFVFPQLVGYIVALFLLIEGVLILVDYYTSTGPKMYVVPPRNTTPPPPPAPTSAPASAPKADDSDAEEPKSE